MQLAFPTTALLSAFPFKTRHIGADVYDREAQLAYVCIAAATGLAALSELTGAGGGDVTDPLSDDLAAGGFKITGLAGSSANGDAVRHEQLATLRTTYNPRVVPSSLHAHSDEFTSNTIANWTEWDEATAATGAVDTTRRYMSIDATGSGAGVRFNGRYKAIPSNEFTFWCLVGVDGETGTFSPSPGLVVLQDGGAANTDFLYLDLTISRNGSIGGLVGGLSTVYTSLGTSTTREVQGFTSMWLRFRVNVVPATSTTVGMDWSSDGKVWALHGEVSSAYAALHYGVCSRATAASVQRSTFEHFRVRDGFSSFYDNEIINGGYLAT